MVIDRSGVAGGEGYEPDYYLNPHVGETHPSQSIELPIGKSPQKPYSGQIMVRVDPAVHARAAMAAELSGKSLAKWTEERLRENADRELGAL